MEELQDAIEDAQYMNAMQDDVPKPTKEWRKPSAEELQKYIQKLQSTNPRALEPDGICAGSLGLYFVSWIFHMSIIPSLTVKFLFILMDCMTMQFSLFSS